MQLVIAAMTTRRGRARARAVQLHSTAADSSRRPRPRALRLGASGRTSPCSTWGRSRGRPLRPVAVRPMPNVRARPGTTLRLGERHAVLRPARAGQARLDRRRGRAPATRLYSGSACSSVGRAPAPSQYVSTSCDARLAPAGHAAGRRASRRRPGRSRRSRRTPAPCWRSSRGRPGAGLPRPRAVELDELADDAVLAQHLGDREHEVCGRRAVRQPAPRAGSRRPAGRAWRAAGRASPPRPRCRPTPQPSDAQAVDHRRVRVGADEGVGVGDQHRSSLA